MVGSATWGSPFKIDLNELERLIDLERAIEVNEQAITSTPHGQATYLNNLGLALRSRFKQTGYIGDLNRAMAMNEQAVTSTPLDDPV